MKQSIRPFVIFLALSGVLLLTGCSGYGGGYSSVNYGVYNGYGYPYYDNDNNNYYYYNRRNKNDRPDRPDRPERPTTLPAQRPGGGMTRPSFGGGMGRPAGGMARGGGGRGGRR